MVSVHDIIKKACKPSVEGVLATIIRIDGSAYRKEGTTMLLSKCGLQMGMISGGCLEEDLAKRAKTLMEERNVRSKRMQYDMTAEDDLGWGRGAGCNGIVHILLEKIDPDLKMQLRRIQNDLNRGLSVHVMREIVPHIQLNKERKIDEIEIEQVNVKLTILTDEYTMSEGKFPKENPATWIESSIFVQKIKPKQRLIIFGAGMDVQPLARLSHQVGFSVTVWDWREQLLQQSLFPDVTLINSFSVEQAMIQANIGVGDYVVIMTHDFQKDSEIVEQIIQIEGLLYLGILGPWNRTKRLLKNKVDHIPQHLYSPVGLPIGAEGPNEIAISILAELITIKSGKQHGNKRGIKRIEQNCNVLNIE